MRAVALVGLGMIGCAPEQEAPPVAAPVPQSPPGTVLLVDDLPLLAEEVVPLERSIRVLYPEYSSVHARRLALTNEILPRLAARAALREEWERARSACAGADEELAALVPREDEGDWKSLGLGVWSAARSLVPGQWSAPLELTGRWVRLRLDERREHDDPRKEVLHVSLLEYAYLDPSRLRETLDAALDRARLTVVDPAWNEVIPETWKRRMRGAKP